MGKSKQSDQFQTKKVRIPDPNEGEILGVVTETFGGDRMGIKAVDGKEYLGIIRGKIKKRMWCRVGDAVLVIPWDFETNNEDKKPKCYIVWRYQPGQYQWLVNKGYVSQDALNFNDI
jgi:translation initiation factor 1A